MNLNLTLSPALKETLLNVFNYLTNFDTFSRTLHDLRKSVDLSIVTRLSNLELAL